MPPVIDTGQTVGEILLEMAVRFGVESLPTDGGHAQLPDRDTEDYRNLLAALNSGYRRFLNRRTWSFLNRPLELTMVPGGDGPRNINSDASRYRLPDWCCGGPEGGGPWRYADSLAACTQIETVDYEDVFQLLQTNDASGTPVYAGVRAMDGSGGLGDSETGWEVIFYPRPDSAYVIRADCNMRSHRLVSPHQRHIAGAENDEAIKYEGLWSLFESDVTNPERDGVKASRDEAVAVAMDRDDRKDRGLVGRLKDAGMADATSRRLTHTALYVNGTLMDPND